MYVAPVPQNTIAAMIAAAPLSTIVTNSPA
jgi:hypothetical protein